MLNVRLSLRFWFWWNNLSVSSLILSDPQGIQINEGLSERMTIFWGNVVCKPPNCQMKLVSSVLHIHLLTFFSFTMCVCVGERHTCSWVSGCHLAQQLVTTSCSTWRRGGRRSRSQSSSRLRSVDCSQFEERRVLRDDGGPDEGFCPAGPVLAGPHHRWDSSDAQRHKALFLNVYWICKAVAVGPNGSQASAPECCFTGRNKMNCVELHEHEFSNQSRERQKFSGASDLRRIRTRFNRHQMFSHECVFIVSCARCNRV